MKKVGIYSAIFLVMNLIINQGKCSASESFWRWLIEYETEEQKLARTIVDHNSSLPVIEQGERIKTRSQQPTRARPQNASQVSILGCPIRENYQERQEEKILKKNIPGKDGRQQIQQTDQWPYSVHGQVSMRFKKPSGNIKII